MSVNYCAIVEPMKIYPQEIQRILTVLETLLWPEGEIDQGVMYVVTSFLRLKLEEYEKQQRELPTDLYVTTWTCCAGEENNPGAEINTEVTVSPDFPYPEGTAEKNRAAKKAKKRSKK